MFFVDLLLIIQKRYNSYSDKMTWCLTRLRLILIMCETNMSHKEAISLIRYFDEELRKMGILNGDIVCSNLKNHI